MAAHYIAMSGSSGCLPDYCEVFTKRQDAVDSLADLHELSKREKAALKGSNYVTLVVGADYAEITECKCATPEIHSDN